MKIRIISVLISFIAINATANSAPVLNIVTSVSPITNIVANVAGRNAKVEGIVPEGVNSHTFEPTPSDAKKLKDADVIIMNGLHLELPTIQLAEKVKKSNARIFNLGDMTIGRDDWKFDFSFPENKGHPNPHLWPNIALAMRYAEITRDILSKLDPTRRDDYYANTTEFLAKLAKLDAAIFSCVQSIPQHQRKLVTYHDSYAYFAPRYGMKVIAAVQPSDFTEPSPREVANIIKQLRLEKVPAVFGSEVFPSKVLEQIAKEAGAKFIDELADDDLPGAANAPNHTFIGMMANNMRIMTKALNGNPECVKGIDETNISAMK